MKLRSILSAFTGSLLIYESDEYTVPKSSIAICTPISRSARNFSTPSLTFSISMLSVISRSRPMSLPVPRNLKVRGQAQRFRQAGRARAANILGGNDVNRGGCIKQPLGVLGYGSDLDIAEFLEVEVSKAFG
jgi:hypothetical protein